MTCGVIVSDLNLSAWGLEGLHIISNVDKLAELKAFVHKTLKENDAIYRRLSKI